MNHTKLKTAIAEAERFLTKARELQEEVESYPDWSHPKESAACKRASMDLTRALADLRRVG